MEISRYEARHRDAVVALSLRAWAPVFESIRESMEPRVYQYLVGDWRAAQEKSVGEVCDSAEAQVWVAVESDGVAGFVAVNLHEEDKMGEIYMIAVDPQHQRQGVASALTTFATEWMREQGMKIAMVETGGDPGHGPARAAYEKAGFRKWPVARYFRAL